MSPGRFLACRSRRPSRSSRPVGAQVVSDGQPQTLLIENAGSSGQRALWLQVDSGRRTAASRRSCTRRDRVTPGDDGRTLYRLPEPLASGHTYYWRSRAADGANTGPYSAVANFSVIDPVSHRNADAARAARQHLDQSPRVQGSQRPDQRVRRARDLSHGAGDRAGSGGGRRGRDGHAARERHDVAVGRRPAMGPHLLLARVGNRRRRRRARIRR